MTNIRKKMCFLFLAMAVALLAACSKNETGREPLSVDQLNEETIQQTMDHYEEIMAESKQRTAQYLDENGFVSLEERDMVLQGISNYAQELYEKGDITDFSYEPGDTCVYMELDGWLSVLCGPPIEGFLANGHGERDIVTLEPNATEFYFHYTFSGGKGPDQAAVQIAENINHFAFTENLDNSEVTIETFKNIPQNSVVIYVGHGGYTKKTGPVLFTGIDAWDPATLLLYTLEMGDKAVGIDDKYGFYLTSKFFDKYVEKDAYNGCLFFLGSCNSYTDSRLVQSIWDKGARGIVATTLETRQVYLFPMTYSFFEGLTTQDSDGNYLTISQALGYAKEIHGDTDSDFWGVGSELKVVGRDDFTLQDMTAPAEYEYGLDQECALSVYDSNIKLYGNYTLHITGTQFLQGPMLDSEDLSYESTEVITAAEPYVIKLQPGVYTFTLTDKANPEAVETFTASVGGNHGKQSLNIYTDFGKKQLKIGDDQYKLNVFLSNFSEQWFNEYYIWDAEKQESIFVPTKFEAQTADVMDLVDFAWTHAKLNTNSMVDVWHEGQSYYGVPIDKINSLTQRFFDRSVCLEEIQAAIDSSDNSWYCIIENKVCMPAADGETYNNMTVAEELYNLGNGTMEVHFRIYSIDIYGSSNIVLPSGTIQDKSVYDYSAETAAAHPDFEYHLSGTAIISPYVTENGKQTYQLVSYELMSENQGGQPDTEEDNSMTAGYKRTLRQYPESAEYAMYDVDKDGVYELIVHDSSYDVYTMIGSDVILCGRVSAYYGGLYAYDGNGLITHDGGSGSLHLEYVYRYALSNGELKYAEEIINTEEYSSDDLTASLRQYSPITDFCAVSDYTALEN